MLEKIEFFIGILIVGVGALAAWFGLKSDVRSLGNKLNAVSEAASLEKERLNNARQQIEELKQVNATAAEHRDRVMAMLDRMETKAEKQEDKVDGKLDNLLREITALKTTVDERTKELHS